MTQYIIRRLLLLPVTLFGVSLMVFAMLQLLDPIERASMYVTHAPKPEDLTRLIHTYGFDQPIYVQYAQWLGRAVQGDLGYSRQAQQPVLGAILTYFPATLELSVSSFVPIMVAGVFLGIRAAVHKGRVIDQSARIFSVVGYSFPSFVFGLLVLMVFYAQLQWFPPGRLSDWASAVVYSAGYHQYTGMNTVDSLLNGRPDVFLDALRHLVLPVLTLAYINCALVLRITRSSMLEALNQEYTTVARAKGLPERRVINRHARPNAMIPVATVGGLLMANLLSGAVLTEIVFNYHGLGWWSAVAAIQLDSVSVLGVALFGATLLVLANLAVDVLYVFIDPRIRFV